MGRWVLDTSTKGTGATMVPLETVLRKPSAQAEPIHVPPPRRPHTVPSPEPPRPRLFKVVDISTREILTEGASTHVAIDALSDVRSIVDVNIYVWHPAKERWRLLTFGEKRLLWDHRERSRRRTPPQPDVGGSD